MRRLSILVGTAVAFAMLATPSVALAWSNGFGGDGYGTHDWVLDEAIVLSGESWVDRDAALLKTDDPDTVFGSGDVNRHVFRPTGDGRGAPTAVSEWFHQAQVAYQGGDMTAASEALGVLAHYFADLSVPFHTSVKDDAMAAMHLSYELYVDDETSYQGQNSAWITPLARQPVTDVRADAVAVGLASRAGYGTLVAEYGASGFNGTVETLTRANLTLAVNGLADVIAAIPTGAGLAPAGQIAVSAPRQYVGQNKLTQAQAVVTDGSGDPVEGAEVVFEWRFDWGTVYDTEYTGPDGVADSWEDTGDALLFQQVDIVGSTTSGAATATDTTWVLPTPVIGYIRTIVPYYRPAQGTLLTASTLILDEDGRPIPGLPVTFSWTHKTTTITYDTATDAWGVARHPRNIGNTTAEYIVSVKAQTQSGGINRSSTATFKPKSSTGLKYNTTNAYGSNRFDTAATVSARAYPSGASTVIIATGMNWPDALGGAALAGGHDAPILLVGKNYVPSEVSDEIGRLGATKAIILGGTGAVGSSVESGLRAAGISTISRIGGSSRYQTARMVAQAAIARAGAGYEGAAFVSTGVNFPDALAASSLSAFRKWPIYLAEPGGSASTLASQMYADGVRDVIILGGTNTVSSAYETAFDSTFDSVTRLGGRDRYETGVLIAEYGASAAGLGWDGLPIATGANFPDALAGGVLAARKRSVMLLTHPSVMSPHVESALAAHKSDIGNIHYLGGTGVIDNGVRAEIAAALQ